MYLFFYLGIKETSGGASAYELKQLEQQNARLRDTLVRLRDLSAHEKHQTQKMQKVTAKVIE